MIQAVLFDMDGLMFDTERRWHEQFLRYGAENALPNIETAATLMRGRNRAACEAICAEVIAPDFDFAALHNTSQARMEAEFAAEGMPCKEGLHELLQTLAARGIPAILATSTSRETATRYLAQAGVEQFFAGMVCGGDVTQSKPAPEVFLKAAALAKTPPEQCLVLEDSPNGVRAGAAAGCVTVMVPDMDTPTDELRSLATAVLPSLLAVKDTLDTL